jgi:hypothetical protein
MLYFLKGALIVGFDSSLGNTVYIIVDHYNTSYCLIHIIPVITGFQVIFGA